MSDDCARTIGRLAAGVAVSLLLGACASMAPEYQRPAPPVSPAFPEAPPATADGALAADIQPIYMPNPLQGIGIAVNLMGSKRREPVAARVGEAQV